MSKDKYIKQYVYLNNWSRVEQLADVINNGADYPKGLTDWEHNAIVRGQNKDRTEIQAGRAQSATELIDQLCDSNLTVRLNSLGLNANGATFGAARCMELINNPPYKPIRCIRIEGDRDILMNREDLEREEVLSVFGDEYYQWRFERRGKDSE